MPPLGEPVTSAGKPRAPRQDKALGIASASTPEGRCHWSDCHKTMVAISSTTLLGLGLMARRGSNSRHWNG